MSFIWPPMLLSIVLVPLGVLLYQALERRRLGRAGAFGGLGVANQVTRRPGVLRRQIPQALVLFGLTVMAFALARPQGVVALPDQQGTVILAFDVSGSMAATDLEPTRMDAAKVAATDFVQRQPPGILIGIVAFSDSGVSVQSPTKDQATVLASINRLAPQKGTSVASGINASLAAIAAVDSPPGVDYYTNQSPAPSPTPTPAPVPAGTYAPAVIVLLSDGENNESPDPSAAAQAAADQGVRIDTVGIGSASGATLDLNGFKVHTQLDAAALQQISQVTGGTYYGAGDAQNLRSIYDNLDTRLVVKPQTIEVTSLFAGVSVLMLVAGGLASLLWMGRLP